MMISMSSLNRDSSDPVKPSVLCWIQEPKHDINKTSLSFKVAWIPEQVHHPPYVSIKSAIEFNKKAKQQGIATGHWAKPVVASFDFHGTRILDVILTEWLGQNETNKVCVVDFNIIKKHSTDTVDLDSGLFKWIGCIRTEKGYDFTWNIDRFQEELPSCFDSSNYLFIVCGEIVDDKQSAKTFQSKSLNLDSIIRRMHDDARGDRALFVNFPNLKGIVDLCYQQTNKTLLLQAMKQTLHVFPLD